MKSKKQRKIAKKLGLHRETLRRLDSAKLSRVVGGTHSHNTDCTGSECEAGHCPITAEDACVAFKTTAA